ncbi:MAG: imidazole glycerol phosphate synthase subunit HisH [Candidatus Bathyarchaeia archaeon]
MPQVSVVNYGVGNLRSVKRGLEKSGAKVLITHRPKDLIESDAIILPGVGAFAEAVKNLSPLASTLMQSVEDGKPLFGICLGLQLLFTRSSEGGSIEGLNLISGNIVKLPDNVKLPQMGWNTINIVQPHPLLENVPNNSYVYFVHTYVPQPSDQRVIVATTEYGIKFPSVVATRNLFATQFHPEKSSKTGLTILKNFVKIVKR